MLKKKNIAMVMAAATVATSVAPVFAAVQDERIDEASLIAKVTELLNTRYSDAKETGEGRLTVNAPVYQNSVYKIFAGSTQITSIQELTKAIEDAKIAERPLVIDVIDKGHKEVNGRIVATEDNKYDKYTNATLISDIQNIKNITNVFDTYTTTAVSATSGGTVHEIKLKSGAEFELTEDSYVLDLTTGLDENGNEIDLTNGVSATVGKKVVEFKKMESVSVSREMDLEEKHVSRLVLSSDVVVEEIELSKFITEFGYNKEGVELSKILSDASLGTVKVTKDGKEYTISGFDKSTDITEVKSNNGRYEFVITLNVGEKLGATTTNTIVDVVVTSDEQPRLKDLRDKLVAGIQLTLDTTYTTLAGEDRFETAIAVSEQAYATTCASAVVLVGENAIVDGLAAAPLATQKDAPILLSKKDSLTSDTIKEIKRVFSDVDLNNTNSKTIYIVGGEHVISKSVEKQLLSEMNVKIERLAGEDRYETSLKIADEMGASSKAYIVGGEGEADAMSIASIASIDNAPIIVTPVNEMTKEAINTIKLNGITSAQIIGGEAKVSTDVIKDLKVGTGITATRIAGETRQETNAAVIKAHRNKFTGKVFVAKDGYVGGNDKLIDALAVAPLAANENAPIVLTTEGLTKSQETEVKAIADNATQSTGLFKVGHGIGSSAIKMLVELLNL